MSDTNSTLNFTIVTLDPDVAGPGVMTGFIASGVIAALASVLHYFLPRLAKWKGTPPGPPPEALLKLWRDLLEDFIQNLSDQQLITGLLLVSLAIAKYWNAEDLGNLSIAGDLAFFSIITHFATVFTLQKTLRELPKLARIRMCLVFITLFMWILISVKLVKILFFVSTITNIGALGWFSLVVYIFDMVGATWVFWDICILLFVAEDVLEARRAIGQKLRTKKDLESIRFVPEQGYNYLLSMLVMRFCKLYFKPNHWLLQALLWVIAEIIFPIRFGNILLFVLLITGIVNVILDMVTSGLQKSWGFGQLLTAFMLLLPFFSLAQNYYEKSKSHQEELGQGTRVGAPVESDNAIEVLEKSTPHGSSRGGSTKAHGATEPRDRVFALYWILMMAGIHFPAPDYTKPLDVVYMEVVNAFVSQDKTLAFLYMINTDSPDPSFPSWVPDLRNISTRWKNLYDMEKPITQMYYNPTSETWTRGLRNADDEQELVTPNYTLSLTAKKLTVYGQILATVSGTPIKMPSGYSEKELSAPSHSAQIDFIRTLRNILSLLPQLSDYHTKEASHTVLGKTLACDSIFTASLFKKYCTLLSTPESELTTKYETFEDLRDIPDGWYYWKTDYLWRFEDLFSSETGKVEQENIEIVDSIEFKILMKVLSGEVGGDHLRMMRRLKDNGVFLCEGEKTRFVGMGGPGVGARDQVVLLDGLLFPVVLRRVQGGWRFGGPAFVYGVGVEEFWPKRGEEMEAITLV